MASKDGHIIDNVIVQGRYREMQQDLKRDKINYDKMVDSGNVRMQKLKQEYKADIHAAGNKLINIIKGGCNG
jgi:hypothetical protein